MSEEIGACMALISSIKTRVDGSVNLTLELNPNDQKIITKLMNNYLNDKKLMTVAFVETPKKNNSEDWGL